MSDPVRDVMTIVFVLAWVALLWPRRRKRKEKEK